MNQLISKNYLILLTVLGLFFNSCKDGEGFNLFSIQEDKELGLQLSEQIASDPANYPVLNPDQHATAYSHINRIRNELLNSGKVTYKDEFDWPIKIIHDDDVLNAFAAPGGYIYVYTGLIKFLASEDHLAGVIGHEIAHADKRHSTEQLTKLYGISLLFDVVLGNSSDLSQIVVGLIGLKFSRNHETEADEFSVRYLCPTDYNAAGAAGFFQKLIDLEQTGSTPQFLSTHPNPDNRVANIEEKKVEEGCDGTGTFESRYQDFKNSLP